MMRRVLPAFRRSEAGASAVEFALLLVPLLLLVLGTFEFGRAMWTREALQSLADDGARCMGVQEPDCAPSGTYSQASTLAYLRNEAGRLAVTLPESAITLAADTTCAGVSGFARVSITYTFRTVVPVLIEPLKSGIALEVSSCFPNQPA